MRTLIKNIVLVTGTLEQPYRENVHIGIDGERFAFVLDADAPETPQRISEFDATRVLSGHDKIAMPGLINTHTHVGMSILRNYGSDLNLQDWLEQKVFPSEAKLVPDDIHWTSMLEMAEMIRSGATGFADMYFFPERGAANVLRSGMRAKICHSLVDVGFTTEGKVYERRFDAYRNFAEQWDGCEGRLRVTALVHSTYLPPLEALREMGAMIQQEKLPVHIHLHETAREVEESLQQYGKRPIALADELGLLNASTIAAHCVHLNADDRRILAERQVFVAHCPTSNLKLASGVADVQAMCIEGLNVSIGTDGASSNNNLNMMEELHLAALLPKGTRRDPVIMPAVQMLFLATRQGARALEMDDELGLIKEGAPADLVLLNTNEPHWTPITDPAAAVVYSAQAADVDTVIVAGQTLMEKREMKTIDLEQAKWQVQRITRRILGSNV